MNATFIYQPTETTGNGHTSNEQVLISCDIAQITGTHLLYAVYTGHTIGLLKLYFLSHRHFGPLALHSLHLAHTYAGMHTMFSFLSINELDIHAKIMKFLRKKPVWIELQDI